MEPESLSFTTTGVGGLLNVLKNRCGISQAFDPTTGSAVPQVTEFDAIWDTGATNSVITQSVIDACGLLPVGMAQVQGVHGSSTQEVFLVNIYLPNRVGFHSVRVTKGAFPGADILIGMDIINMGDFAVTNKGGITKFSFSMPFRRDIDFVEQDNQKIAVMAKQHGGSKKNRKTRHKTYGRDKHRRWPAPAGFLFSGRMVESNGSGDREERDRISRRRRGPRGFRRARRPQGQTRFFSAQPWLAAPFQPAHSDGQKAPRPVA